MCSGSCGFYFVLSQVCWGELCQSQLLKYVFFMFCLLIFCQVHPILDIYNILFINVTFIKVKMSHGLKNGLGVNDETSSQTTGLSLNQLFITKSKDEHKHLSMQLLITAKRDSDVARSFVVLTG